MKKNHIFVLRSSGNAGKTASVKLFSKLLQEKYPKNKVHDYYPDTAYDIKLIIEIGKIKIGIESQGDPNSRLSKSLDEFVQKKCDIIICATRTRGKTVECVNAYQHSHKIEFIEKYKEFNEDKQYKSNLEYAEIILERVSRIIETT